MQKGYRQVFEIVEARPGRKRLTATYTPLSQMRNDSRNRFNHSITLNPKENPCGGITLLAYAKGGVASNVAKLADTYQTDGRARIFKFPIDRLDEVAAILKPRKRRTYSPEHREVLRERLKALRQNRANQSLTNPVYITINPAISGQLLS